jgi:hypothetical protein
MTAVRIPLCIRGEVVESDWVEFGGRGGDASFLHPDPRIHAERYGVPTPMDLGDLYEISLDDILDYLEELGCRLQLDANPHLRQAYEIGLATSGLTPSVLEYNFRSLPWFFRREQLREIVEQRLGIDYVEGWVERQLADGRLLRIRAFGSRALHVVAGNSPVLSAVTVIRNALTRSDAIIKAPSNDPATAAAIALTMTEMAPDHPLTRHVCVAYWKGGDVDVEKRIYRPEKIEKIVAWGGAASVTHVTRYIQPGLELITLDPKRSASIIGPEAFESEETMRDVALRTACDVGTQNQEACACARVVYVLCRTDGAGLDTINRFGEMVYDAIQALPDSMSTKTVRFDPELRSHLDANRLDDEWFRVIGGEDDEGAVVVSQIDEAVDYSALLSGRTVNLVPVDDLERVTAAVTAYTQTVGIYPESLKRRLRDTLPLFGAQRLVNLGFAGTVTLAMPQDAIEPLRRMCKWIVDEECDGRVPPMWERDHWEAIRAMSGA